MINNQEELAALSDLVNRMYQSVAPTDCFVEDIMRAVCFHDWVEWAPKHRWSIPPSAFNEIDSGDAEALSPLVTACVTFLKSDCKRGEYETAVRLTRADRKLHDAAQAFLLHRGIAVATHAVTERAAGGYVHG